ncbi:RIP metalloprotease RseP [Desulfobaculum bizertense]|uniref:Zinc metalloprotease n=1 Tax=Desulfobaculum bizertense DSM 18034 TaxID=1121442 RepID=A0A1T4VW22_9BACT|nr:RIP metalloprotease RseP [Desulfobaculum bizertense]UIJ36758.1 RIP metalloprotease RseP [Desulfobaculum bizertense]SKA69192.1 site-2 protease. Metallo peptidase. MEROPS family M50B [Desulfobaculum bizertense DSM 18034]
MQGPIAIILVLGALIFFHELGHFLAARMLGIGVKTFSLGFGPKLLSYKKSQTRYQLSLIPLGGYVQLLGENTEDDLPEGFTREESFALRPPLHRMAVVAAGPIFNFILAWFIYSGIFMSHGMVELIPNIGGIQPESSAAVAGIQPGDTVTAVDGQPVRYWREMADAIAASEGKALDFEIQRGDETLNTNVTPRLMNRKNIFGETISTPMVGISASGKTIKIPLGVGSSLVQGGKQTWNITMLTLKGIGKLFQRVVPLDTVGGPIMIAQMVSQQAKEGLVNVLFLTAIISINLGLLNLFPIPVLDGGHLLFLSYEIVSRRPVSEQMQVITTRIGLFLLLGLMVLATYNDILRLFTN